MLTARQLKIIKLIMNNPGIHGKEISEIHFPHEPEFHAQRSCYLKKACNPVTPMV